MDIKKNNDINVTEDTESGGDNRGKFSDRLKQISKDKSISRKIKLINDESFLKTGARNILKIALAMPSVIYTNIRTIKNKNNKNTSLVLSDSELEHISSKKIKVNKIKEINVSLLKEKKKIYLKNKRNLIENKTLVLNDDEVKVQMLQKEIVGLVKKRLVKNLNELEILQSELYILGELTGERINLAQCEMDIKEIKKLLSKIKSLKEKYDYLKDNLDFEYMLEYGEDFLVDKILELKELCSSDEVRYVVDNYKILDEYKYLYLKIDKLQDDVFKFEKYKNDEIEKLKQRDLDFEKFKNEIYNVDRENTKYMNFVNQQEKMLIDLEGKGSEITSYERIDYHLKGFSQLLGNSFKYLGLLLVSPLRGLVPSIATQTLVTKNMVKNLYKNLEWEESKRIVYEAINYNEEINKAISDLDYTSILINSTLEDIIRLKEKYKSQFSSYGNDFPQYRDAIKKLNKIENAMLGNKLKIDIAKTRMKEKEKQNTDKLRKVKKLNNAQGNSHNS